MASSTGLICSECQKKGNNSAAIMWCPECSKSLCTSCKKGHDRSNASINHKTIPADVYQNLPTFVSNLNVHCDKHKIKYEKYCPDHQFLLCKKCKETVHKTCKGLLSLDQVIKNTKSSVVIGNMKKSIHDIQLTIKKIKQNRNDNLTSVNKQIKDIHEEISNFRSQLNKTLDDVEKELVNEMENIYQKTKLQMTILYQDLQKFENKIKDIKNGIEGLEKYGTDFQNFLVGNQVENIVHKEEEYLQSLIDEKVFENMIIKYNTDSNLQTLISDNMNFGHISVATIPSDITVFRGNVREVQIPVKSQFSELLIAQRFRVEATESKAFNVTAMCVLPNMDMIFVGRNFVDYKNTFCLIVHDSEGLFKYSFPIEISMSVYSVTSVDDRTVAIVDSTPSSQIIFVDILKKKYVKILEVKNYSRSISRSNDVLYVTNYGHSIDKFNLRNNSVSLFYTFDGNTTSLYDVAAFGDKICCSKAWYGEVILFNSASDVLWKYKDDILGSPMKATFDNQGNIYVVGGSTYNVVFISHDGKQSRQVLSKEDGIMNTMSIDFDLKRNLLIVVSLLGDVVVYNCSLPVC